MSIQKHLLIIEHSQSGRSQSLALAIWRGARAHGVVQVRLLRALDASIDDLVSADAVVLVCAEHFGSVSGGIKHFLDRVFYPYERLDKKSLTYCLVVSAGNDGANAVRQVQRIMSGMQVRAMQEPLIILGEPTLRDLQNMEELGLGLSTGVELGIF